MDLESLHASPHPIMINTTGLDPRGQEARRVAVEVLLHEALGFRDFHWVTENDGACMTLKLMRGDQVLIEASADLGEILEGVAPEVLMWTLLRMALTQAAKAVPAMGTP